MPLYAQPIDMCGKSQKKYIRLDGFNFCIRCSCSKKEFELFSNFHKNTIKCQKSVTFSRKWDTYSMWWNYFYYICKNVRCWLTNIFEPITIYLTIWYVFNANESILHILPLTMDSEELSVLHMLHPYTVYDCNAAILLMFNEHSEYSVFASELLDIL